MHKRFDAISLGEVMLRLTPIGKERLSRAGVLESRPGGSELNVMAGIAALGEQYPRAFVRLTSPRALEAWKRSFYADHPPAEPQSPPVFTKGDQEP